MLAVQDDTLPLPGQPLLFMLWGEPLTDAGGVAHLSFGYEGFIANDLSIPRRRVLTVIGDVSSASVPEPGSIALVALAVAALVRTRRGAPVPASVSAWLGNHKPLACVLTMRRQ